MVTDTPACSAPLYHAPLPETQQMRLRLRASRLTDKADHLRMWSDPRTMRYIGGEPQPSEVIWGKFLSTAGLWHVMGYGYWVFADRASDKMIGVGGLSYFGRELPELESYPEAGWAISPEHWGEGYATEAMGAALAWADQHIAAPEVRAIIEPAHGASVRVAEKLGFRRIGDCQYVGSALDIFSRPQGG
jgi:RimJ/RimL family protein N-acetyltransferase